MQLITRSLRGGGHFVATFFDPEAVLKLLQSSPGNKWNHIEEGQSKYHIELLKEADYQPRIKLLLPFTNGHLIEETLVNKQALISEFTKNGFTIVDCFNFSKKFTEVDGGYMQHYKDLTAADRTFISLHMALIVKAPTTVSGGR